MKLVCKSQYSNVGHGLQFEAGVIRVDDDVADYLLRDAPENFEVVVEDDAPEVVAEAIEKPVKDRMLKLPRRKKAVSK